MTQRMDCNAADVKALGGVHSYIMQSSLAATLPRREPA
jgi:hypothetical protein